MIHPHRRMATTLLIVFGLIGSLSAGGEPEAAKPNQTPEKDQTSEKDRGVSLFDKQILPVLVKHCYECHSKDSETIEGGLELDSPSGMLRGGDSGPMLEAHHADKSELLRMLRHEDDVSAMPPDEKLSDEVIAAFEEWIRLGAPDSRADNGPTAKEQRLEDAKQHWSFIPPQAVEPPAVKETGWPRDPLIDNFVLSRMEAAGLKPTMDANRRTLVRRIYFDLIGLPPSSQDVEAFVADESLQAVENLVDRLLASPQFGERWGRYWLDVVRFAESSGMEFNFTYPHAWPYRNYTIDALNADKPFDVFLREQIAGDLLPAEEDESPEATQARRVAPSMLSFGPKRHNSGGVEFQMDIADDQIDAVFKSSMAMTVSCARCHDHKFDPIPTADYYALAGIFLSTEPLYGTIKQKYSNNPTDLLPIGKDAEAMHAAVVAYDKQFSEAEAAVAAKKKELTEATEAETLAAKEKTEAEELLAAITARIAAARTEAEAEAVADPDSAPETEEKADTESEAEPEPKPEDNSENKADGETAAKTAAETEKTAEGEGETASEGAESDAVGADAAGKEANTKLEQAVAKLAEVTTRVAALKAEVPKLEIAVAELKDKRPPAPQYAMTARDRAKPADTKIAIRGAFNNRGDVVPRGFLSAVNVPNAPTIDPAHSGRLELAQWITSPDNPLTARVMVNRIWSHLFGRGIVQTVDNFGVLGKPPTHPQLLDALALRFIEEGWSVKKMLRAIILSRSYQLSSHLDENNMKADPDNRLLWRQTPRRLEAEAIRDAILAVSGQLDLQRPEASTVTGLGDKLARSIPLEKIQPPSRHRSVYLPIVRDYVPELFDLFDFPSPSLVTGQRSVTNVPSQALYLRNSSFAAEQARHAAERLLASADATDDPQRVALAMQWTLGRAPSESETTTALQLIAEVKQASAIKEQQAAAAAKAAKEAETPKEGAEPKAAEETKADGVSSDTGSSGDSGSVDAWSAWFLTLFTTAEFRYLVDIES